MPSPFPGMEPYLEDPALWPDVHHRLISEMQTALNARIRPKYYARVEERVYISDEDDPGRPAIVPDIRIAERPEWQGRPFQSGGGTAATLEVAEPVEIKLWDDEIHEARLEVVDRGSQQVVTVIELLSPSNKIAGSRGRASFERKRQEIKESPTHWMEIDLLRTGEPIAPRSMVPPHDYLVYLSRVERRPASTVWPIRLHQQLPVITVPLRGGDPDAALDLQSVLNTAYDRAGYDLMIDYRKDPVPALPQPLAEAARELLQSKGLR